MTPLQSLPQIGQPLSEEHQAFLKTFTKSCRHSIIQMVTNSQSGHPGGSLSCIDYLATVYAFIISQTGERIVVSNGHISPAVYSTLAEMDYIPKADVIEQFRQIDTVYEGHITRHIPGIDFGTGPLGIGVSVAAAYAKSAKMHKTDKKVYGLMGDGEAEEGQVYEMIHFAKHYNLNNLILFVDYNKVQLTASLKEIQDIDIHKIFEAGGWEVIDIDGHNHAEIWEAIGKAHQSDKPVAIIGNTIMGMGVDFMEETGRNHKSDWHGKAPAPEDVEQVLKDLEPSPEEVQEIDEYRKLIKWHPEKNEYPELLSKLDINTGSPNIIEADKATDCRSAYGNALLDLAKNNPNIIALTADVRGSVKTDGVAKDLPDQYIECGIAEQNMMSLAGGLSLDKWVPFASTFGAFLTSRPKDQARVNDINYTNVKMVATHCGLSVGEDGPTHQSIDDISIMAGQLNTHVIEPTDANHTDHIIRFIASHYGNFYVRMGRHKFPVITKEDGSVFYDQDYQYEYGKTDIIREGSDITIAAAGATVSEAIKAREELSETNPDLSIEIVATSSIKKFDDTVLESVKKTKKLITVEDHNIYCGLGSRLCKVLVENGIQIEKFIPLAVKEYQLSGTSAELYAKAGIDSEAIKKSCLDF
ncbi:transketolase [Patescibacteria group bacterium]